MTLEAALANLAIFGIAFVGGYLLGKRERERQRRHG